MKQQKLCLKSKQAAIPSAIAKIPVLLLISNFSALDTDEQCCRLSEFIQSPSQELLNTQLGKALRSLVWPQSWPCFEPRTRAQTSWGCSQTKWSYYPMQFMLVSEASVFCFSGSNSLDTFLLLAYFLPSVQHFTWNYDNCLPIQPVYHLLLVPSLVTAIHTIFECGI